MTFPLEYQQFKANYDDTVASFDRMGLSPRLTEALKTRAIDVPTPVQQQAIVPIIEGRNVMVKAQSGTGRMVAFVVAALQKVDLRNDECQVLILTPGRAAALEVLGLLQDLGGSLGVVCRTCLEDEEGEPEQEVRMPRGTTTHIVVATPGRVLSRIQAGGMLSSSMDLLMVADLDTMLLKQLGNTVESIFQLLTPSTSHSDPKLQVALCFDLQTPELVRLAGQLTLTRQQEHGGNRVVKIFVRKTPLSLHRSRHYFVDVTREEWKFDTICDLYETYTPPNSQQRCKPSDEVRPGY
ncbi:translation initiation factor eIF4A [Mortierella sp. 14UC]|nr:translation initiation factor eIF4A [Mortierella sp. 14UC]